MSIMLLSVPVELFLLISKLVQLPSPTLLLREDESIPADLCLGDAFSIACVQYAAADAANVHQHLVAKHKSGNPNSPVFISGGDHRDLLMNLKKDPLLFASTQVWVVPLEFSPILPLRADSRVLFYSGTTGIVESGGYAVYESYAVKGGSPINTLLFQWNPALGLKGNRPVAPNFLANRSNLIDCFVSRI